MNSYRVAATGEDRHNPMAKLYHVDITVNGYDDFDAKQNAIIYLDRVYGSRLWRVDAVNQLTVPRKPTRRKPRLIIKRKPRRKGA